MRVFISHTADDSSAAQRLREALNNRSIDAWDPAVELFPGSNWLLETGRALERADAVVFLFSPASAESPSMRREVEFVLTHAKFEDRVFPVLLSSEALNYPWILTKFATVSAVNGDMDHVADRIADMLTASTASAHVSSHRKSSSKKARG
jgi:hypothetical protein